MFAKAGPKRPLIQHAAVMTAAVTVAVRRPDQSCQEFSSVVASPVWVKVACDDVQGKRWRPCQLMMTAWCTIARADSLGERRSCPGTRARCVETAGFLNMKIGDVALHGVYETAGSGLPGHAV